MSISPQTIITHLPSTYEGITVKPVWGETAFFYNPGYQRKHGIYVATIKDYDGANDTASYLNCDTVFRFAFGLIPTTYTQLDGSKRRRPARGEIVATHHDFTVQNQLMPHPVYA